MQIQSANVSRLVDCTYLLFVMLLNCILSFRSEGITRTLSMDVNEWNPFEEEEDVLFGKEFDKLRRGSNSSRYLYLIANSSTLI